MLYKDSDDDGEANTYDYKDSFIDDDTQGKSVGNSTYDPADEDSDYDPEAEADEDVQRLKKEAKGFMKNTKLQKKA